MTQELVNANLVGPNIDPNQLRLAIDHTRPSVVTTNFSDTEIKLAEAKFFLDLIERNSAHQAVMFFGLSGFLAAARTVTLFLQVEGKDREGFHEWYEGVQNELKSHALAMFIKEQRDIGAHVRYSHIKTVFDVPLYKDSDRWVYRPNDGVYVGFSFIEHFWDNGLELCRGVLDLLARVVAEARVKNFLSSENARRVTIEFRDLGKERTFRPAGDA
jgi:hypothetical protein